MANYSKNNMGAINAYNKLKDSNNKKKKWIWGLSVVALLSLISTTAMVFVSNNNVSAKEPVSTENEKIETLEKSNAELEALIKKLESNKSELENKLSNLEKEKTELNGVVDSLKITIRDNQSSIGSLTNQVNSLDTQITSLREEKQMLENESLEKAQRILEIESEIESLESEIIKKEENIASLNEQITSLKEEKQILENDSSENAQIISELEVEIENMVKDKENLENQIAEKDAVISNLNEQIVVLESTIQELQSTIDSLNEGRTSISIENENLEVSSLDFNYFEYYKDDVVSVDNKGNTIPYTILEGAVSYSGAKSQKKLYYINGTPENGSFAVRTITEKSASTSDSFSVKNMEKYVRETSGYSIDLNQIEFDVDSMIVDSSDIITEQTRFYVTNMTTGGRVATLTNTNPKYTFTEDALYSLSFHVTVGGKFHYSSSINHYVNTSNNPVLRIEDHIFGSQESYTELLTQGFDESNYVVTFKAFDNAEDVHTLTISKEGIKRLIGSSENTLEEGDITLSEGLVFEHSSYGGQMYYANSLNVHFRDTTGANNGYIVFDFDMLAEQLEKTETKDFSSAEYISNGEVLEGISSSFELIDGNTIKLNFLLNNEEMASTTMTFDQYESYVDTQAILEDMQVETDKYYLGNTYVIKHEESNTLEYGAYIYEKTGLEVDMTQDEMGKNAVQVHLGTVTL